jgi:ankyrin repeat protein
MRGKFLLLVSSIFVPSCIWAQQTVCELFKDLKAADGQQLILTGDLIVSKDLAVLGAVDCDNQYKSLMEGPLRAFQVWPTAIHLRPSAAVLAKQREELDQATVKADQLRRSGKPMNATGTFAGRLRVSPAGELPAELTFDSVENVIVEELPDPRKLPIVPICDLFQNLSAWKGQRIAVRGESVSTSEGSWITGRCKGAFYTNGYRWPVALDYAAPAYYSSSTAKLSAPKRALEKPKGYDSLRGRNSVIESATYVGRLRMRNQYTAVCRAGGDYITNGFGHLNGAAAELIVETVVDIELAPSRTVELDEADQKPCEPPNHDSLCAGAPNLAGAVAQNCVDRTKELLAKDGIDSKDGNESSALITAIRLGNEAIVRLLLDAGAPVNPITTRLSAPLAEAGFRNIGILKLLLASGAKVDAPDHHGVTYLASYGYFNPAVTKILLEAGANPDARNEGGATALMRAADYGYEEAAKLLIDHRADVNLTDNHGRSALMHAASGKYVDVIPHLLAAGADPHVRDAEGKTALDIAKTSKNQAAEELLLAAIRGTR